MPSTHDYSKRYWGHDYCITRIKNNGQEIHMLGWGCGLTKGDYLILENEEQTTRYKITNVEYNTNPPDMWTVDAEFAPRTYEQTNQPIPRR